MLAFNMGTGTPKDALEFFEYCNYPSGTYFSDWRRKNGAEAPYGVKYWCIGNEMDGEWQICNLTADDYGKKAGQTMRMIRKIDAKRAGEEGAVKLVVCGSSSVEIPTYPEWDRIVLEHTYDEADFISMHRYYEYMPSRKNPLEDFLGSADDMAAFIETIRATIRYVRAKKRSKHDVYISFDEWNVWSQHAKRTAPNWVRAPHLIEDQYTMRDLLVFGGMLNTLLNHADIVKVACLAQLVNVIAPILTQKGGAAIRQTIFYPFRYASENGRGEAIRSISTSDTFDSAYGRARLINEAVTHDAANKEVCVFLVNYGQSAADIDLELRSFGALSCKEFVSIENNDLDIKNTFASPDAVVPEQREPVPVKDGCRVAVRVAPMSWNFLKFTY